MNLQYKSTRNDNLTVTASQAILKGLADDGGLFVPVQLPKLSVSMNEFNEKYEIIEQKGKIYVVEERK